MHKKLGEYKYAVDDINPEPGTNICDRKKIRKGDINTGFAQSDVIIEAKFRLPQSDHIAMEPRTSRARIAPDGTVYIKSSSQSPFAIKKQRLDISGYPIHPNDGNACCQLSSGRIFCLRCSRTIRMKNTQNCLPIFVSAGAVLSATFTATLTICTKRSNPANMRFTARVTAPRSNIYDRLRKRWKRL